MTEIVWRLARGLGHGLFKLVWRKRFAAYTLPGTGGSIQRREPRLIRVTGWRSCIWDMPYGQRERVMFEPFAGCWRGCEPGD